MERWVLKQCLSQKIIWSVSFQSLEREREKMKVKLLCFKHLVAGYSEADTKVTGDFYILFQNTVDISSDCRSRIVIMFMYFVIGLTLFLYKFLP